MFKRAYRKIPKSIRTRIWTLRSSIKFKLRIKLEKVFGNIRYPYKDYCDTHKCIFIHIPKNAGTSIITYLSNNVNIEQEHNTYWDYLRSDPERYHKYEKFCIVRNPWDRVLSAYHYLKNGGNKGSDIILSKKMNAECKDFTDFILNWIDFEKIYNIKILHPQYMYIYDFQNDQLMIDNILKFENLSKEFSYIQKKLDIYGTLPSKNQSNHQKYQNYYTDEMKEVISRLYARDIKLFGYKFGEQYDT